MFKFKMRNEGQKKKLKERKERIEIETLSCMMRNKL